MKKAYAGSQVIGYLGLIQAASIPQLMNSPEAHVVATWCLLGWFAVLLGLLCLEIRRAQYGMASPPRPPRFWTVSNAALCAVFTLSSLAAWKSGYAFVIMTLMGGAVIAGSITLFAINSGAWKKVRCGS